MWILNSKVQERNALGLPYFVLRDVFLIDFIGLKI